MPDDWRERFRGPFHPDTFAPPNAPAGGLGAGFSRQPGATETRPFSSAPQPGSPAGRIFSWHFELPRIDLLERAEAVYDAITLAPKHVPHALVEATGQELHEILAGLIPGLLMMLGILALTTAVGAVAGAALGALAFGVGAAPGAAAGAGLGFEGGVALLDYLGLAFLVGYIGKSLVQAASVAIAAVKLAWESVDNPATERQVVDHAADRLAFAVGLVFRGVLQGIVAFLLAKGTSAAASRVPELVGKLRSSKLGAGFAEWVERNWTGLIKDPKLKGELEPETRRTAGGSGEGQPAPAPAPKKAPRKEPEKKITPSREARLQELAKDPDHANRVEPKGLREAEVGLACEESGKIPGPIVRDPTGAAEFIDANGTKWDVKGFYSVPGKKGSFDLATDLGTVRNQIAGGENVIVDTGKMSPADIQSLRSAIKAEGLDQNVIWYP